MSIETLCKYCPSLSFIFMFILLVARIQLSSSFKNTKLTFPIGQNTIDPFKPLEFIISFETTYEIVTTETIYIYLPQFTRKLTPGLRDYNNSYVGLSLGSLVVSPSLYFNAGWDEGTYDFTNSTMYAGSRIKLTPRGVNVPTYARISLKIYKGNDIGVSCGFPSSEQASKAFRNTDAYFKITSSLYPNEEWPIEDYESFGIGCSAYNDCNDNGLCDFCRQKCICDQGYGSEYDIIHAKSSIDASCSERICPTGKSILDLPNVDGSVHQRQAECSNAGTCDRLSGECRCFEPYFGTACDKIGCPNSCSGHGTCMSMRNIAEWFGKNKYVKYNVVLNIGASVQAKWRDGKYYGATIYNNIDPTVVQVQWTTTPTGANSKEFVKRVDIAGYEATGVVPAASKYNFVYGTPSQMAFSAWDADIVHGCVCDSSWAVGYEHGEYQLAEYFGADCSLKRCPSGDDPLSQLDEQNCLYKNQAGSFGGSLAYGEPGNYCHISCSNRGVCDHRRGTCDCYVGFYGDNCGLVANQGLNLYKKNIPLQENLGSAFE